MFIVFVTVCTTVVLPNKYYSVDLPLNIEYRICFVKKKPEICQHEQSLLLFSFIILLSTQFVVAVLWSVVQLRRGRLRICSGSPHSHAAQSASCYFSIKHINHKN